MLPPPSIASDARSVFQRRTSASDRQLRPRGFTLVELLAVMLVIVLVVALTIPAVNAIKGGRDVTRAAYDISGALETARTYALANNTYVWVGFYEEDGGQASQNPAVTGNGGRVIVSLVASRDGTRYGNPVSTAPLAFGAGDFSNLVALTQLSKLLKIDGAHLAGVNDPTGTSNHPARPAVPYACQVGDAPAGAPNNTSGAFAATRLSAGGNVTTFTYPVPSSASQRAAAPQYTFTKIIEFNPQGEASKITENTTGGTGLQSFLEIALQPARGNSVDPRFAGTSNAAAAIQIEGLTGQVRVYRP